MMPHPDRIPTHPRTERRGETSPAGRRRRHLRALALASAALASGALVAMPAHAGAEARPQAGEAEAPGIALGSVGADPAGAEPQAAPAAGATAAAAAAESDSIVVTGTRRAGRLLPESLVPVDVLEATAITSQASPDLKTILKNLVPSFNQQRNALADGSAFVRPPTLRGLPPDQILVLVNGHRRHRSALVQVTGGALSRGAQGPDLQQIPVGAIERIEILRDGASAQYGSDAIAGVINIILRQNRSGIEIQGRAGQTYRGDGDDLQIWANVGTGLGQGFLNLTGEFVDQQRFNRGVQRPDAIVFRDQFGGRPREPVVRYGQPEYEAYRVFLNAEIPLSDTDSLYAFGNYGFSDQVIDFNWRRPITVTTTPPPGRPASQGVFTKSIATTYLDRLPNGNWNEVGRTFEVSEIFPNGFTPQFASTNQDLSLVFGYRARTGIGIDLDGAVSFGRNRIRYRMSETVNPSLGPDTPTSFYLGKLEQREINVNLDATTEIGVGLAKPLLLAFGGEFRKEIYEVGLGDRASWEIGPYAIQVVQRPNGTTFTSTKPVGANGFPGFGPESAIEGSRRNWAAYAEADVEVSRSFQLAVAGRFESFSDFGDTVNGKVALRFAPSELVSLRGAASTGFRAPTPGQLFTRNTQTTFITGNPFPVARATLPPSSAAAQYYGAEPLEPEKSVNLTAGIVLTPAARLTLSADYYNIRVKDRIGITGDITVTPQDRSALFALGVSDAFDLGIVNFFTNGFRTRTEGVDLVAQFGTDLAGAAVSLTAAVNYNRTRVTDRRTIRLSDIRPGDTRVITLIDDVRKRDIENLLPKWRGVLSLSATSGWFDGLVRLNYYDEFTVAALPQNDGDKTFSAEASIDAEIGVTFRERFRLAAGVENLFDNYPEKETRGIYPISRSPASGSLYPDASPLGYMGGYWYVRLRATF